MKISSLFKSKTRTRTILILALAVASLATLASVAFAATYQYCNGCTINSMSRRQSAATRVADLSYTHRLSGPGSGVKISTWTNWGDSVPCSAESWTTQVACSQSPTEVHGNSFNHGAGNYGFNAHLRY